MGGGWTYCCLEYALVAPICVRRFLDFLLCCVWVDDAVLARDLFAVAALVGCFFVPVFFELLLEASLQLSDLSILDVVVATTRSIDLEKFDLVLDTRVEDLGLRDDGFERAAAGCVGTRERALVCRGDAVDLLRQCANICFGSLDASKKILVRQNGWTRLHWNLTWNAR